VIGRILGDRYEILERIGSGGMSLVYRAHCSYLRRDVAIKILRNQYADDAEFLRHFRREARAAARLSHPNIVNIYDVGQDEDLEISYIIMELVTGQSLKSILAEHGPLDLDDALAITDQILSALESAHKNGVIHRDIKPDNVMVDESGRVKVADFGIARAQGTGTFVPGDKIVGSVRYMSPEQARGRHTDARSDLYSVSIVLYEMLTGAVPFDGDSTIGVALRQMNDEPEPIHRVRQDIPRPLSDVIMSALAKAPTDRFASAGQMREALEAARQGRSLTDRGRTHQGMDDTRVVGRTPGEMGERGLRGPAVSEHRSRDSEAYRSNDMEFEEDELELPRRRWGWTAVIWILLLLAASAVVGYSAYWVWDWFAVPIVEVPDVQGERVPTAEAVLVEHGLEAEIVASSHDDEVPANHVLSQKPGSGNQVRRGQTVELTVSEGPHWVEGGVPDVTGESRLSAQVSLENVGLTVDFAEEYHDEIPSGRVIDQIPEAGARVQHGSEILLEISKGPEPRPFALPGYIGEEEEPTREDMEDKGLRVRVVRESADLPSGLVVQQDPNPGTEVAAGDTVTLIVSEGSDRDLNEDVITVSVPSEPDEQVIRVELIDRRQSARVVFHDRVQGGTELDIPVYWSGEAARVFVYSGDSPIEAITLRDE